MVTLQSVYFGNSLQTYLFATLAFIGVLFILRFIKFVVVKQLLRLSGKTKTELDDLIIGIIDSIGWPVYFLIGVYMGLFFTIEPPIVYTVLSYLGLVILIFYATKIATSVVAWGSGKILHKQQEAGPVDPTMINFIKNIIKGLLWLVALLILLQNLGVNVTSVIAGLGIGGLAIAFALQGILSDIFASVSIYFDKPFEVGDYIVIGGDSGTVEHIGIKSTRIKTLKGQELIVSNQELTSTRVNNYKKMDRRRVVFSIGLTYDTTAETLAKVPLMIKGIIQKVKHTELERVHFASMGDYSLNFEIVYYVDTKEYAVYMDIHQEIILKLKGDFDKKKIEFAYPTQTVFLEK